jgi:predicted permease
MLSYIDLTCSSMSFVTSRLITMFKGAVAIGAIGAIGVGVGIGRRGTTPSSHLRVLRRHRVYIFYPALT